MYGAIIGDIVGSVYEFSNIKTKDFPLFAASCDYTDDTVMTIAVAKAILRSQDERLQKRQNNGPALEVFMTEELQRFGRKYPHPMGAYGYGFHKWLQSDAPKPYNSYGNGAAMRVSACGLIAVTIEEAIKTARISAKVTHNHPEGMKGAEAVAAAIFFAKTGKQKEEIRRYIGEHSYEESMTLDMIRPDYQFDSICQGTVPQAMTAFFESTSFEDAIRNAISIGGDSDTLAAITGSIAWTYYRFQSGNNAWIDGGLDENMRKMKDRAMKYIPDEFARIASEFHERARKRMDTNSGVGFCSDLMTQQEWEEA